MSKFCVTFDSWCLLLTSRSKINRDGPVSRLYWCTSEKMPAVVDGGTQERSHRRCEWEYPTQTYSFYRPRGERLRHMCNCTTSRMRESRRTGRGWLVRC